MIRHRPATCPDCQTVTVGGDHIIGTLTTYCETHEREANQ